MQRLVLDAGYEWVGLAARASSIPLLFNGSTYLITEWLHSQVWGWGFQGTFCTFLQYMHIFPILCLYNVSAENQRVSNWARPTTHPGRGGSGVGRAPTTHPSGSRAGRARPTIHPGRGGSWAGRAPTIHAGGTRAHSEYNKHDSLHIQTDYTVYWV